VLLTNGKRGIDGQLFNKYFNYYNPGCGTYFIFAFNFKKMRNSLKIAIIVIIVVVLLPPLVSLLFFSSPFIIKKSYDYLVKEQEKVEREGRELIQYDSTFGIYEYLKSDNKYEGTIEKIEDNKIYFLVDKEEVEVPYNYFKRLKKRELEDVEDYEIVFDLSGYNLDYDPVHDLTPYSERDHIAYSVYDDIKSIDRLKDYIDPGDYVSIEVRITEVVYEEEGEGKEYKSMFILPFR